MNTTTKTDACIKMLSEAKMVFDTSPIAALNTECTEVDEFHFCHLNEEKFEHLRREHCL